MLSVQRPVKRPVYLIAPKASMSSRFSEYDLETKDAASFYIA